VAISASGSAPERLRGQVLADLRPIAPIGSPWRRAAMLAPLAAVAAIVAASYWGPRPELTGPAFYAVWAASALQWGAGLWLLSLAFREAVPGRALDRRAVAAALALTAAALAGGLYVKDALVGTVVPAGRDGLFWTICVEGPLLLSAPLLILASLFVARAFPVRPALAGALTGLAAAVLTDAGWHIGCFVSAPGHVIGAHWLAVAAMAGLGAAVATLADRRRWRR
jgi:hypothetical protein